MYAQRGRGGPRVRTSYSQVAASASSSDTTPQVVPVKLNTDNGKTFIDNQCPIFGGFDFLFNVEASKLNKRCTNIPHTVDSQSIENPHHIAAEVRRNAFRNYVRSSGNLYSVCASLYCSSRDITIVKQLQPQSRFNFLYGDFCAKDFYTRAPEIRRMTLLPGDEKVDLTNLKLEAVLGHIGKCDSVYLGDVYQVTSGLILCNFIQLMLGLGRVKEVVWFGHMMSTPIGYQGESGFYHYSGRNVISYPHKDPTPSDVYTHPPPFLLDAGRKWSLKCEAHSLGSMGTYITFRENGSSALRDVLDKNRILLGFKAGALSPYVSTGENPDFYVYEKYALKVISEFGYRADLPQSTAFVMLRQVLTRMLGKDDLIKISETYASAADTIRKIYDFTFEYLCKLYNEQMVKFRSTVELEELNLSPWWSQLGKAVSSRASTITSTVVAVVGVVRTLQGLRTGTVAFSLLSSLLGPFPAYCYSIFGAPVVEAELFSWLITKMAPWKAAVLMAALDGVSNCSLTSGIVSLTLWMGLLTFYAAGHDKWFSEKVVLALHIAYNFLCFVTEYSPLLFVLGAYNTGLLIVLAVLSFYVCLYTFCYLITKSESALKKPGFYTYLYRVRPYKKIEAPAVHTRYENVEVEVPKEIEINGKTVSLLDATLRDVRVEIDETNKSIVENKVERENITGSFSSHKVETFCDIDDLGRFIPPPRNVRSYLYAIGKRILSQDPPRTVALEGKFLDVLTLVAKSITTEDPVASVNVDNVEEIFGDVIKDLPSARKETYRRWWDIPAHTDTWKCAFMSGVIIDESICTRSMMLKLDEGQEICKPRCLINAHVGLNIFYKRHFDKIHGGLKREPIEHTVHSVSTGMDMRTFTIFAAGLTIQSLCNQVSSAIHSKWNEGERIRIIAAVAGDDTWLSIMERVGDHIDIWYYETDATSFDASQGDGLLNSEISIYEEAGINVELLRKATFKPITVDIDKYSKAGEPIHFALNVTGRATGFPNTSLGNSIVESIIVQECLLKVFAQAIKEKRLFREVLDETTIYVDRAKELGITFKVLYSGPVLEKASFLRGFFYDSGFGLRWAPAIGRLAKLSKTLADLDVLYPKNLSPEEIREKFQYDVFYGLRTYDWPDSMTLFDFMNESPTLVVKGFGWNPSGLVHSEEVGQRYSLEVLARRYDFLNLEKTDQAETFAQMIPLLTRPDISQLKSTLAPFYRYDYR